MIKKIWPKGKIRLYGSAIELFNQGRYRRAIRLFRKIIVESAGSRSVKYRLAVFYCAQAYYELGRILFAMGNYNGALQEFEEVLRMDPERTEVYEYMGRCYEKIGARPNTITIYSRMAEMNPYHCPAGLKIVSAFHRLGIWDRIETACLRRIEQYPRHADLHFILGLTYLGLGRHIPAIPALEQAVTINPEYWPARIRLGTTYALADELGKADEQFSIILKKNPDYVDLYHHLGVIHAGPEGDPGTALKWFRMALARNPNFDGARVKIVVLLCAAGRYAEAIRTLKEGIRLNPGSSALTLLLEYLETDADEGLFTQTAGTYGKNLAIAPSVGEMLMLTRPVEDENMPLLLEEVIDAVGYAEQYTGYPDFHWSIGLLHYRVGRLDEAEKAFREALALNPAYTRARIMLFNTLKAAGKIQSALEVGTDLLDRRIVYPDFLCGFGELCLSIKDDEKAEMLFRRTLELNPDYEKARIFLKQLLEKEKDS